MVPALSNQQAIVIYFVDEPVFLGDPARPVAAQILDERLRPASS
jgi:hypothetical protein